MNVFIFTGNLGRDAEQRFTGDGKSIVSFAVAVTAGFGDNKTTTWVKCSLFGKRGESLMPYLTKGQQVAVSGELSERKWTNRDGVEQKNIEVNVANVDLIGGKRETAPPAPRPAPAPRPTPSADFDDDIPF